MKHKCDMCEKSCQSATLLYNHKVQIHRRHDLDPTSIPNVKLLACEFCQMKVAMNMREHVKQAHPERLGEYVIKSLVIHFFQCSNLTYFNYLKEF